MGDDTKGLDNEIRPSHPTRLLRVSNAIVFLLLVAVNIITQTPILGSSDIEISARFPTPLTPASYVPASSVHRKKGWAGARVVATH